MGKRRYRDYSGAFTSQAPTEGAASCSGSHGKHFTAFVRHSRADPQSAAQRTLRPFDLIMPTAFLPDTRCMIAAVCSWHEHHEAAAAEIERRLAGRAKMVVAAPALVEAYAVLTRLPAPHRLSPETALTLLQNNFLKLATTIALDAKSYRALLLEAPKRNLAGGRIYDAVVGACAGQGKASAVLTLIPGILRGWGTTLTSSFRERRRREQFYQSDWSLTTQTTSKKKRGRES